ncbi:MAG TPA: hypothetical protein PLD33_15050 [Anaerolineales bacterium]|nr:hypothetical protein [Anaerolineales bacterium]
MKDKNSLNAEERALAEMLAESAAQVEIGASFQNELEKKLMNAHKPKTGFGLFSFGRAASTLASVLGLAILSLIFIWAIRAISSKPQPAIGNPFAVECPVTTPNGSTPPGETATYEGYLGNGKLWTSLWPEGKIIMTPENRNADGSLSMKWLWWRGVSGPLSIEGRRLDAEAEPLRSFISSGYGDIDFQVSELIFPTTGCWEVTGYAGNASLTFVTEVIFEAATPTLIPTIAAQSTPISPTATFEVLPTASSTLFRDDFEGTLGNGWEWTHENSEQWNLTDNGWLEIMVSYGIINNSNMDNLLLRQAPAGNFELETKLIFAPMEAPQMAGLLIYENNANYVELVHGACLTQPCLGDTFYFDQMTRGSFIEENFATPVFGTGAIHLRLRFEGDSFTAYASENGTKWKLIGTHSRKIQPLYIGLFAGGSFDRAAQIPAQFDYFIVNALP